ncbi:IMP cyclohydrolase / Phosphoribosylaminoimidazolecarboxamide formyltransferase [hydrothermal vent metagenome]|uniref:IMP cyclohydrolase / Phosphoribosylaminoimidazolecarboxamide formyltransferase n=1 Tax=hydrothermal vent metagenome TaxID=652676 RepID=A0A3B0S7H9_9ZZZZ
MGANMTRQPVRQALISVFDKTGVVDLATRLVAGGVVIISSGGTAQHLRSHGVSVVDVADLTGAKEMLGGRVKTLHPTIHGAILADRSLASHVDELSDRGISPIDLVVVNLYPFEATVADPNATVSEIIEKIDIGGPTMIRAAAKNHAHVAVATDPDDYPGIAAAVEQGGTLPEERQVLARKAFAHTAGYDAAIVRWFDRDDSLPGLLPLTLERVESLRYGENPHQPAAIYTERGAQGWWREATIHQGKAMSFNNYADTEAAWRLVGDLSRPGVVVMKHMNACGAAEGATLSEAFGTAWECDPKSGFGGIVALNEELDEDTARRIIANFVEVVIAPGLTEAAANLLASKKNLRVVTARFPEMGGLDMRRVEGGMLVQYRDSLATAGGDVPAEWRVVSERTPTDEDMAALRFAWTVAGHTKSNAIVIANGRAAVGVGAGDQSRVGAAERAIVKAGDRTVGAVAASDAFLPFRDTLDILAYAGVRAVVEPGGSKRDDEVIAAADESGVSLVFTNKRHFRH